METSEKLAKLYDSECDLIRFLETVTDLVEPKPEVIHHFSWSLQNVRAVIDSLNTEARSGMAPIAVLDEWGNADAELKRRFTVLERHMKGFGRETASYKSTNSVAHKQEMLNHFRGLLIAHDAIAEFVKGYCPAACPELMMILTEWKASKKM